MKTSLVIRTRDQWSRLRLVLASVERQDGLDEVIVVDDGSTDETWAMLDDAASPRPLVTLRNARPMGQSAAWNVGAEAASGDLLVFLDGDTLAGPGMVAAHARAHAEEANLVGRGETWHVRCTRSLSDPETGEFWPHEAERGAALAPAEREALRITAAQVRDDFASVARRAGPGVYAGAAPRRLHDEEMRALREQSGVTMLWAAASGSNSSVRRDMFLTAGGFHPEIDINEHRELAYRLCHAGARMIAVEGARTYHLTHRSGWRDPLVDARWEAAFRDRHPDAPIDALKQYWRDISSGAPAPAFFGP
jgi:glycosyltransferase involved in cell wall biosynthesis